MKLVILDRDGTINADRDDYVKSPEEWEPLPGVLQAIAKLNHGGWHVVVATNQSGIGRGLFDMGALNAMHQKLNQMLSQNGGRVDAFFFCPHAPDEHCNCRKPLPGLMEQITQRYNIPPAQVPVVGDSLRDAQAALAAGCESHLVRTGKLATMDEEQITQLLGQVPGTRLHQDLAAFAEDLLKRSAAHQGPGATTSAPRQA
jgi:D-glycero-D-manno-heptose 1,7-bisphosphate phosphatase